VLVGAFRHNTESVGGFPSHYGSYRNSYVRGSVLRRGASLSILGLIRRWRGAVRDGLIAAWEFAERWKAAESSRRKLDLSPQLPGFSAAPASGSPSTSARVPTAAINHPRTSTAPIFDHPRSKGKRPAADRFPRHGQSCDAPVMIVPTLLYMRKGYTAKPVPPAPSISGRVRELCIGFSASAGGLTLKRRAKTLPPRMYERRGVVFLSDRGSSGFMYPLLIAATSLKSAAPCPFEFPSCHCLDNLLIRQLM